MRVGVGGVWAGQSILQTSQVRINYRTVYVEKVGIYGIRPLNTVCPQYAISSGVPVDPNRKAHFYEIVGQHHPFADLAGGQSVFF